MQTTMEDIRRLVGVLEELIQPLLEGEVVEDAPYESMKRPHLVLQEGSKTYGRAFRIHFTGGSKYGSGHCEPRGFSDYLGGTKAEAEQSLRKLIAGIHTGLMIAENLSKESELGDDGAGVCDMCAGCPSCTEEVSA